MDLSRTWSLVCTRRDIASFPTESECIPSDGPPGLSVTRGRLMRIPDGDHCARKKLRSYRDDRSGIVIMQMRRPLSWSACSSAIQLTRCHAFS